MLFWALREAKKRPNIVKWLRLGLVRPVGTPLRKPTLCSVRFVPLLPLFAQRRRLSRQEIAGGT